MRLLVLQHQDDAPPGLLAQWAHARGHELILRRPDRDERPPHPSSIDAAVILGSDASVLALPAWAEPEVDWLRGALRDGLPCLGICFGAQLIAHAAGGTVSRAAEPEIAWIRVDAPAPIGPGPWMSWHEDEVTDLPPGATRLDATAAGLQAYALGPSLAVQFHPEVSPAIVAEWAVAATRDLTLQAADGDALARTGESLADELAARADALFDAFAGRVAPPAAERAPLIDGAGRDGSRSRSAPAAR